MVVHKPGKPHKLPPTMALVFSPTPSSAGLEEFTSPRETSRSNSQQNLHAFVSSSHQNIHLQHGPLFSLSSPDDPLHDASPSNFQEAVEYDTDYTTEYNEILHSFYQPLLPDEDASASLYALPDHILQVILALVDVGDRLRSVPLVCTRFRDLLRRQHHSLWNKLQLPSCDAMSYRCWSDNRMLFRVSATQWFMRHGASVEWLDMTLGRKAKHGDFVLDLAMAALPFMSNLHTFIFNCQAPAALVECMPFCTSLRALQVELFTNMERATSLSSLQHLHSLCVLKLNWNTPITFPTALLKLTNLCVLTIGAVDHLPREVGMLTALTRFEMLSCVQRQTPEHLSALQNLNQLGLYAAREGQPLALSNSLSALTRLTCMWVADGRLDNLHALSKLSALRSLWLHTCALQGVPPALAQTTTLERLIVLNDDVQVLPEWLAQLPYLSSISIIDNASAVAVSSSITRMTALTSLRVRRRTKTSDSAPLVTHEVTPPPREGPPGAPHQPTECVSAKFYYCDVSGVLETVMTCPPGLHPATLQEAATVWSFVGGVLSKPTKRMQQL